MELRREEEHDEECGPNRDDGWKDIDIDADVREV